MHVNIHFNQQLQIKKEAVMATLDRPYHDTHAASIVIDILRMLAGAVLIFIGIHFGSNPADVSGLIGNNSGFLSLFAVHYIMFSHLAGGVLLMLGLLTRIAAIAQLPILLGALIFTSQGGLGTIYTNFWFTLAVLVVLLLVSYYGSGRFSLDEKFRERRKA